MVDLKVEKHFDGIREIQLERARRRQARLGKTGKGKKKRLVSSAWQENLSPDLNPPPPTPPPFLRSTTATISITVTRR